MNSAKKFLIIGLLLNLTFLAKASDYRFEIGIGANLLGPALQMNQYMIDYHFDITSKNWLFGGYTYHPHHDKVGFSLNLLVSKAIKTNQHLGVKLGYNTLSEVFGEHKTANYLFVAFHSFDAGILFCKNLNNRSELRIGPLLSLNHSRKTSASFDEPEAYKKMSPGIYTAWLFTLWDKKITSGKLSAGVFAALPSSMGPFSAKGYSDESKVTIPEMKYNFSHISITLQIALFKQKHD